MKTRSAALVRAIGALVLAAVLVVGVPLLLVTLVGNPFPSELPTVNEIRILLTQNGQGFTDFLLGSLAVLIWIIWAQLVVALVVEAVATARHTETRRLRIVPGMQGFAARLVAAVTLATMLAAGPLVAPAVGALSFDDATNTPAPTGLMVDLRIDRDPESAGARSAHAQRAVDPSGTSVEMVVNDHTELWDLADAAYGDGVSWKLIAQANAGALDARGLSITPETEVVAPGTKLVLPGTVDNEQASRFGVVAAGQPGAVNRVSALADSELHRVEVGDSMWTMAQDHVAGELGRPGTEAEVAEYWVGVVESNQGVSSGNVDMIYPGELIVLPGSAGEHGAQRGSEASDATRESVTAFDDAEFVVSDGPVDLRTSGEASTPTIEAAHEAGAPVASAEPKPILDTERAEAPLVPSASARADTSETQTQRAPAVGLVALGSAMLSAGIVSAVRRRRDAQRRMRPAGTMAPAASAEAAAFEVAMLHSSHELKESTQGLGWRALPASAVATLQAAGPAEVHATATGELTAVGVRVGDEMAQVDRLAPGPDPHMVTGDQVAPSAPVLAASMIIGTDTDTGDAVLLDLAPATTIGLRGSVESVHRFVRSAVLDLAVSDRADDICVVAVAVAEELDGLERVHVVPTYADALSHIIRTGQSRSDGSTPVVVLAATQPSEHDSVQALLDAGATVLAPDLDSAMSVCIEAGHAVIQPSGTVAALAALDDHGYRAVSELVDTTSALAIELVDPALHIADVLDVATISECPVEAGPIELKVLGPVEVCGAAPFSSLKAVDVIAYLAFHRHGVDADQIKTWVWPAYDPPTDKAFANVMSRARTGLGAGEDGEPYLSRAGADRTYRLSSTVTSDFDRVRALGELADSSEDSATTLSLLQQALELIRGVPFTGGAASSFAWADNHVRAQVEYTIDELVHRCADLALDLADLSTARWAALKGLELVPGCEQCFRRRFLIAGAGNNRSELRRAMADLEAAAMVDLGEPEAVDNISGELLDLYNELDRALVAGTA